VVSAPGALDELILQGCLTTGGACNQGKQLDSDFAILATSLNSQHVPQSVFGQLPMELNSIVQHNIVRQNGSAGIFAGAALSWRTLPPETTMS
jgi:hypothetical protein